MLQKLCLLMASHGCPPTGLVLHQELAMDSNIFKGCQHQPLFPSVASKPEMIRYQLPSLNTISCKESRKPQIEWFNNLNQFFSVEFSAQRPILVDAQATCPNTVLFSLGIVEQCTRHDEILQFITSGTAEAGISGVDSSLSHELMDFQLQGIDECQQPFTPLIYPNGKSNIPKPLLDIFQDSYISSKITVHPDGQVTFMGSEIEMKNFLSLIAESYLSQISHKGEKQSILVPHFSRLNINEADVISHSSTLEIHSVLTAPLRSPEKVKAKPSKKKNKKVSRERDLYKKNYLHACESLLSLMVDKRQHRQAAILSLKKSGPELPELLTQFSAGIAGTGLAVLLSVICKLACGMVPFCASKLFNTGFGFGLVWLSWAVSKLRDTIVHINKNAGKLGLKDEDMIQKVDKSVREIYFRAAALLAVAALRLA